MLVHNIHCLMYVNKKDGWNILAAVLDALYVCVTVEIKSVTYSSRYVVFDSYQRVGDKTRSCYRLWCIWHCL